MNTANRGHCRGLNYEAAEGHRCQLGFPTDTIGRNNCRDLNRRAEGQGAKLGVPTGTAGKPSRDLNHRVEGHTIGKNNCRDLNRRVDGHTIGNNNCRGINRRAEGTGSNCWGRLALPDATGNSAPRPK